MARQFFVHVLRDGSERTYREEPTDLPTIRVWSAKGREYTVTTSLVSFVDKPGWFLHGRREVSLCPPPGEKWRSFDRVPAFMKAHVRGENYQVWFRVAVHPADLKTA